MIPFFSRLGKRAGIMTGALLQTRIIIAHRQLQQQHLPLTSAGVVLAKVFVFIAIYHAIT
jgi:hypothetical protein